MNSPGLILAAILISAVAKQRTGTWDWATVPPSFVIEFASLLLLGPNATMLVVAAVTVTQWRMDRSACIRSGDCS